MAQWSMAVEPFPARTTRSHSVNTKISRARRFTSAFTTVGLFKRLRAAGVAVFARGELIQFAPTIRSILVDDPNGIHIELYEEKQ